MEKELLKTQILLELILSSDIKTEENEIIDHILPLYLQKLNCSLAACVKFDNNAITSKVVPFAQCHSEKWAATIERLKAIPHDSEQNIYEIKLENSYCYAFTMPDYGYMVLERKTNFDNVFKNELYNVIKFSTRIINHAIEQNKRAVAETQIANERKLLRTIIDNIPINIYAKDIDYRKTLANKQEIMHLGLKSEDDVLGKTDFDLYDAEIANNTLIEDLEVIAKGKAINAVEKHIGNGQWALISKLPLQNDNNETIGLVGVSVDFTKRRKNREQLQVFHELFNHLPDAIQIALEDGTMFYINKEASKRLGIKQSEIQNYSIGDFEKLFEDKSSWEKHVEDLKQSNNLVLQGTNKNHSTGIEFPVEVTVNYINVNNNGYVIAISRDITERKKSEAIIIENEKRLQQLAQLARSFAWELNTDGLYTYISDNVTDVLGFDRNEIVNKIHCFDLRPERMREEFKAKMLEMMALKMEVNGMESLLLDKHGNEIWVNTNAIPLTDKNGLMLGYRGSYTDITERKNKELELLESENRKASLVESMNDLVFVLDNELRFVEYYKPDDIELYLTPELFLGKKISEVEFPSDVLRRIQVGINECIRTQKLSKIEYWLNFADEIKWYEMNITYLRLNNNYGLTCVVRDISESKKNLSLISQQIDLQELLIKISTTYINIDISNIDRVINHSLKEMGEYVNADRTYIFTYDFVNKTCSNTYEWCNKGIAPEIDNLQQIPLAFFPDWVNKHVQGEPFIIENILDLPDEGPESLRGVLEPQGIKSLITIPMMHNDEIMGFIGFDSVNETHIYTENEKQLLHIYAQMVVNVQIRRRSFEMISYQEQKYRNLISNMSIGLVELDMNDHVVFANQQFCEMANLNFDRIKGLNAAALLNPRQKRALTNYKYELQQSKNPSSIEMLVKNRKGEHSWWLINGAPHYNDKGELIGTVGVFLDISAQKKLQAELETAKRLAEKAAKAKESFLTNMSHEIRTPLNVIIGMVRELGKEKLSEQQRKYVVNSESSANHLLTIINNILDMSKIEAGQFTLDPVDFSITALINDVHSILSSRAAGKNIKFEFNVNKITHDVLKGDTIRLRQIFINLLSNAIKFTDEGHVHFTVEELTSNNTIEKLRFTVADTGIGISEEFLSNLFEKFSQEQTQSNRNFEGTGLGMSISKELVEMMGGTIAVKSTKGVGTEITIELGFEIGDVNCLINKHESRKIDFSGYDVLIVEDNEMNRFIARQSLLQVKCNVYEANNGIEAIEKVQQQNFDLILMDIQMPKMDGVEATLHIRNNLHNNIPIVALTANAFRHDIDRYIEVGMNDFLIKPYKEEDLYAKIERNIGIRSNKANSECYYKLDQINELSGGDESFVKMLIDIFVQLAEETLSNLQTAYVENDIAQIKKLAHKIKPSLANMQIDILKEPIAQLEALDVDATIDETTNKNYQLVIKVLEETIKQLKNN